MFNLGKSLLKNNFLNPRILLGSKSKNVLENTTCKEKTMSKSYNFICKILGLLLVCILFFFPCAKNLLIFCKSTISTCNTFSFWLDCIFWMRLCIPANIKGFLLLTSLYRFTEKWITSENFMDTTLSLWNHMNTNIKWLPVQADRPGFMERQHFHFRVC